MPILPKIAGIENQGFAADRAQIGIEAQIGIAVEKAEMR
jgi:hypothetical protein